ncbi:hypothetical protein L3X38_042824 [Prunus dulcis]|uniref:DDE Tnp4 domain-containing protein n=1 Tax=Prunus dulcis TaxID=3755 RepID=A0AAD4UWM1_PRUDU|nr:hypothetical protein L3X38_042824 [Prunus dulcis]
MNVDIEKVILENASRNAMYIAPMIQKEILNIFANKVRKKIREEVGEDGKFCILIDEALDKSKKEQMAIILRFIGHDGFIRERFFDIIVNFVSASTKRHSKLKFTRKVEIQELLDAGKLETDKYYLVDAGYTNGLGFLAPYRGTRYHLSEWSGNNRPENYKELFNIRHSIAKNVVERGLGLLKKRWSILYTPSFFNIKTQVRIINACFVLHNFIRTEQANDPVLEVQDLEFLASVDHDISNHSTLEGNNAHDRIASVQVNDQWTNFQATLAIEMFHNYQV